MRRVGIYDQVKSAIQDVVAPALHELRDEIHALRGEVRGEIGGLRGEIGELRGEMKATRADIQRLDQKIDSLKGELVAEIRRLDARIDGMDRELRTAIDIRERLAALETRRS